MVHHDFLLKACGRRQFFQSGCFRASIPVIHDASFAAYHFNVVCAGSRIEDMVERDEKRSGVEYAIGLALLLMLLPVLYVLSTGPAAWLWAHGYISENALGVLYAPLNFACDCSESVAVLFDWYTSLWR